MTPPIRTLEFQFLGDVTDTGAAMSVSTVLAKALFDNTAESPEELAFRKGDILMVLEREQSSGSGWWLCSLHGRQGIAPGNRLRLLQTAPPPGAADDAAEGVYRSPPPAGGGGACRAGELRRGEAGRPRSHSSSGGRPRPDWDVGPAGRPRSPSLRGRGSDLYQAPPGPRQPEDATYLVPRETRAGGADDCYLVPKGTPLACEEVYQSPTGGAAAALCSNGPKQDAAAGTYQTPTPAGAAALAHQHPSQLTGAKLGPQELLKRLPPSPAAARAKAAAPAHRGSPLLLRAGQNRAPGSPGAARKPPPPAPPVRGVTRKEAAPAAADKAQPAPAGQQQPEDKQRGGGNPNKEERISNGPENSSSSSTKAENQHQPADEQVYDTPPSGRWQQPVPAALRDDDGIYDTPRSVPPPVDSETEVYDVPTITLNKSTSDLQADEGEDEVYSVPTLPGVPLGPAESAAILPADPPAGAGADQRRDSCDPDGGVYDMPALSLKALPNSSSSSSSSSAHRLSVSSNGSGDVPWRAPLCVLVQAALSSAPSLSSRELAASLAEVLSAWKAGHPGDAPPPLQQAWARLSDLLPALAATGAAAPSAQLLVLAQRCLEESALLLTAQGRPRLPSQDSLSRRPLPALPGPDGKPANGGGMGSRKGSWIQERPLPPTPQPAFPPPPPAPPADGEDDPSSEYAGIGLTPAPPPAPAGDSVGYVKLQGKPEPPPDMPTENGQTHTITAELTPSPPLPGSLSLGDSELLSFYSSQSLAHLSCLADAIDVLFASVRGNQPPRVFVAKGKSLIVTAHKLVFIGDTLSRLLSSSDLQAKIATSRGRLCQSLKAVVAATKGAAQSYPSVSAAQEMVDRVAELSQQAAGFSTLLQRLAEMAS
ncbi:LOW QUALITY PROTEIN: embryonal Fyn-associated substrate [Menidia menidia]